jgi:hypothetical protein
LIAAVKAFLDHLPLFVLGALLRSIQLQNGMGRGSMDLLPNRPLPIGDSLKVLTWRRQTKLLSARLVLG